MSEFLSGVILGQNVSLVPVHLSYPEQRTLRIHSRQQESYNLHHLHDGEKMVLYFP